MSFVAYKPIIALLTVAIVAIPAYAMPKITVTKRLNIEGITEVQIYNETRKELACYVAIDGQKRKFRLLPFTSSDWYKSNSPAFKHTDYSTWCDYIEFHPRYKQYKN
ncbi:hypothetical protein [Thalassotalea sp. PLHSN55]|uniref:hypothetical protein n=1 Tax=Thalassotalea sp. PLHSN55 TaxID=3435888 RepID=UPI003F86C915